MREELDRGLAQLGVTHSARQSEELLAYLGMLLETNRRMNLTAIREENTALRLHLLDSATLLAVAPPPKGSSVMDVGTGGGLPGMVLAIEPMINLGTYKTRQMPDGWLVCTRDGLPSAHFEKTVAITEDGPVVLTCEEGHRRPV